MSMDKINKLLDEATKIQEEVKPDHDYYNDEELSEYQNIIKQESIKMNIRQIKCDTNDLFIGFINWLALENYNARVICQVVEKPHAFKEELNAFLKWREEL